MPPRQWVVPVAVATLLVLAGCGGESGQSPTITEAVTPTDPADGSPSGSTSPPPTTSNTPTDTSPTRVRTATTTRTSTATVTETPTRTPTATETEVAEPSSVRVQGGDLPVNATRVFRRVERLLGADARPPTLRIDPDGFSGGYPPSTEFQQRVGLAPPNSSPFDLQFRAAGSADSVILVFNNISVAEIPERELELVFAHEFVHVVQDQRRRPSGSLVPDGLHPDVWTALTEGGAVYVTHEYSLRYGVNKSDRRRPIPHRAHDYRTRPNYLLPVTGEYYFGARYLNRRLDTPDQLWSAYEDPPTTMEQVIHGPGVDSARPLDVEVEAPRWNVSRIGRQGELRLRAALRGELSMSATDAAATGWGNDTALRFENGNTTGNAWVFRSDDAGESAEFESHLREFADGRAAAVDADFRVRRVAPETVVLLTGPTAFLDAVSLEGSNRTVAVSVTDSGR